MKVERMINFKEKTTLKLFKAAKDNYTAIKKKEQEKNQFSRPLSVIKKAA